MKSRGKGQFIAGFVLGAVIFSSLSVCAADIIAKRTASRIMVNNKEVSIEAYNINDRNYFQLRDLANAVGFGVDFDGITNTVFISTNAVNNEAVNAGQTTSSTANATTPASDEPFVFQYKVGDTPGNIIKDPDNFNPRSAKTYTDEYMYGSLGQCAWYADNRFYEVHGIRLALYDLGSVKDYINNAYKFTDLSAIKDIEDIRNQCIAVYKPTSDPNHPGHLRFVEYVERDSNGNPTNIYFTESNGADTITKGQFDPGVDGVVKKETFEQFKAVYSMELIGYIVPSK